MGNHSYKRRTYYKLAMDKNNASKNEKKAYNQKNGLKYLVKPKKRRFYGCSSRFHTYVM
jgi:hypothetical protein